jgi:cyclopropane fatty-acyl-phospholipid synthase-like methyltransferase
LIPGEEILKVGCGTGVHLEIFMIKGLNVTDRAVSEAMRERI